MKLRLAICGLGALSAFALTGCGSLDVQNPNAPDRTRALSDPAAIEAIAAGTVRTWINSYTGILEVTGVLSVQARTLSSSWNNGNMNFYSGVDIAASDTAAPPAQWSRASRGWQNDPAAAARTSIEGFWQGFYSALSSANDALTAIRKQGVVIGDVAQTKRSETVAAWIQGASLMGIALNYDKGYMVDENTDLTTLVYVDRKVLRDSAEKKLLQALALAQANTFTTEKSWTNGIAYTNKQIAKIINTMLAMNLAWYPRDDSENAAVNWTQVAAYASAGMSTGATRDTFAIIGDGCTAWCQVMMPWFTDYSSGRLSTRVAHFLDPSTQKDPFPLGIGNPQPNSPDKRMGDGSYGNAAMIDGYGNAPKTGSAGTDFAWSSYGEVFRPARGYYHQSNIGFIRWDASGVEDPNGQWAGYGYEPFITPAVNDLLWAEALLRVGGAPNLITAANLINNTRVNRGGLSLASVADGQGSDADGPCMANGKLAKNGGACTLFSKLLYEYEIELLQMGPAPYYNQRHLPVLQGGGAFDSPNGTKLRYIQGLIPNTPREMPVPAKELGVKGEALYSYGGSQPAKGAVP